MADETVTVPRALLERVRNSMFEILSEPDRSLRQRPPRYLAFNDAATALDDALGVLGTSTNQENKHGS